MLMCISRKQPIQKEPEPEEKVLEEQPETVFDDEETGEEEAFSNAVQEPEEEQELSCEEEEYRSGQ